MTADPNKLYVLAALRQTGGTYGFTVRWLPGASDDPTKGDNLPTAVDIFTVSIQRPGAGLWLQTDLTWSANACGFDVRPHPYAMIDPPRRARPIPDAPNQQDQWLVAVDPTGPVDPTLTKLRIDATSSAAMGVCHLLDNLDKDRIAFRVWQCLSGVASAYGRRTDRGTLAYTEPEAQREAARLAIRLVREARRPRHLADMLAADHERLRALTLHVEATGRLDRHAAALAAMWRRLAFAAAIIEEDDALLAADYEYRSGTQTRQQLRLKAVQGGDLLDFWAGLDGPVTAPDAADRGKAYSSSVLLGLGLDVGTFSAADVESWCAPLPNGSSDYVNVGVSHRLDPHHARIFGVRRSATGHLKARSRHDYDPGSTILKRTDLRRALADGSSNPPLQPAAARINYDLVKSWVDPDSETRPADGEQDTALAFTTGDGHIEILITPATAPVDANGKSLNTVVGYNVYGVWEGASAASDAWFQVGQEPGGLSDLRPWLMTRRYSLYRDLEPALPPIGGAAHPNLTAALMTPPWHPVLKRTVNLVDASSGKDVPLPSVTNTEQEGAVRLAVFGYDLRRGAQQAPALPPGVPGAWDPVYPPQPGWTPEAWRAGSAPKTRPQGYRFWVTAVDSLGQESPPLAVATADKDAGQTPGTVFTPTRRTQLRAPPRPADDDPDALSLSEIGDRVGLRVEFSTPQGLLMGTNAGPGEPGAALDPAGLRAVVQVLRRRLKARVGEALRAAPTAADPVLNSKTWRNTREPLLGGGWEAWTDMAVDAPSQGRWRADFPLRFEDRSFEYLALVGFAVKGRALPFWHPTARSRTVQVTRNVAPQGQSPEFKLIIETMEEAPGVGMVATSVTLPIKADAPARTALDAPTPFQLATANPILPPPSVNRDTVLMRLISQPVAAGERPLPLRAWPDEAGPKLTEGQIATCESAIARTHFDQVSDVPAPSPEERRILGRAMARHCAGDGPRTRLARNPMIGFRGMGAVSWQYRPLAASPPSTDQNGRPIEAEASLFRIFAASAPRSDLEAQGAPIQGSIRSVGNGRYEVTRFTGDAGAIAALTSGVQPALVRIAQSPEPAFANLLRFEANGATIHADLAALDGALPSSRTRAVPVQIYMGRILRELPNERYAAEGACSAWVPIPGGPAELLVWWVCTVSAEQRIAPLTHGGWPVMAQRFAASVQPRPPGRFSTRPVNGVADFRYDPAKPGQKDWCPRYLDAYGAEFLPRLYLSWEKPDEWVSGAPGGKLYVEIDREYVRASQPGSRPALAAMQVTPWQAIRSIETMKADQAIDVTWIDAIRDNWLLGREVDVTPQMVDDPAFIRADQWPLTAGGVRVEPSPEPDVAVRFIDYFAQPNSNRDEVMESDYRYRYRARYAQDLGTDSGWRFLRSEWTDWSDLILPLSPDLTPQQLPSAISAFPEIAPPRVRFVITSRPIAIRRARHHAAYRRNDVDWLYRIMIYRRTQSLLTRSSGPEPGLDWIEVGSALELKPDGMQVLIDDRFERASFGQPLSLKYRLILQQIVRDGSTLQERPIRTSKDGFLDFTVEIPAPSMIKGAVQELEVTEAFNVR